MSRGVGALKRPGLIALKEIRDCWVCGKRSTPPGEYMCSICSEEDNFVFDQTYVIGGGDISGAFEMLASLQPGEHEHGS